MSQSLVFKELVLGKHPSRAAKYWTALVCK